MGSGNSTTFDEYGKINFGTMILQQQFGARFKVALRSFCKVADCFVILPTNDDTTQPVIAKRGTQITPSLRDKVRRRSNLLKQNYKPPIQHYR